jgi:hypothetical protein
MKKLVFIAFAVGLGLSVSIMAQVPSYVPTNGLVGWWPFNGNANDESGNGNNGTVNGATLTTDRFGNAGQAYSFDGVDDFINYGNSILAAATSASVSFWFQTTNFSSTSKNIYNKRRSPSGDGFGFGMSDSICGAGLNREPAINVGTSYGTPPINFNSNWTFITATWTGNILSVFKNGILGASLNLPPGPFVGNEPFYLGKGFDVAPDAGGIRAYEGKIDDIGIWNRALTDQEISDLYNANICYDYVTVTDTLVINTGISGYNPITYLNTLKIWPNPSNDHITIDAGNLATMNGYSIKIEDAQGQQVFQNAVNQQQFYVDITTWGGNGLYFVRIIDPQGNTVDIKKIVLQ